MMKILVTAIVLMFTIPAIPAIPAPMAVSDSPDPLFQDDETLEVTITAPFKTLVRERSTEEYLPGVLTHR